MGHLRLIELKFVRIDSSGFIFEDGLDGPFADFAVMIEFEYCSRYILTLHNGVWKAVDATESGFVWRRRKITNIITDNEIIKIAEMVLRELANKMFGKSHLESITTHHGV